MRIAINKFGNLEVENNTVKYRFPFNELNTDDIDLIEKNIKRKVKSIETEPYYLLPIQVHALNSSCVIYYDMHHLNSFNVLRELPLGEQLKYFSSLVEIAKKQSVTKVLWNRYNFVVDQHEGNCKALIYETDNIKILENEDEFYGVIEMIITSLTTLNKFIGKPKRVDFINPSEDVIQFAETILKIDNLEDLDNYIETKRLEYEHGLVGDDNTENEVPEDKKSKLSVPFKKINFKSKNEVKTSYVKKKKKTKTNDKKFYIIIGIALVFALIFNFSFDAIMNSPKEKEGQLEKAVENQNTEISSEVVSDIEKTDSKYNEPLLEAYRYYLNDNHEKAIKLLENVGYENLAADDKNIMLLVYEANNEYEKVMDLNPQRGKEIVNHLISVNKINELVEIKNRMETNNPYVDFEVAYLERDWEKLIELIPSVDLNGRKEEQIVEAYAQLGEFNKAEEFVKQVGNPDLMIRIQQFRN